VDLASKRGVFAYDPSIVAPDVIAAHIEDMGFEAALQEEDVTNKANEKIKKCLVSVMGMTCQSCVKSIESAVRLFTYIGLFR